eukprot:CAMPEP_0194030356 /NCGR_PEP_ID=MMETSP0009_2-20130614/3878_1 /TAXON_ID=210454 /ORGANISM="Grammatophora oceanica, Strain CCMP 410" /LENGTH=89 /DNA_ID=CAMNT_0038670293 /DNA_START=380 /DNA_END=646 /DNA_ORIENTATION=-
MRRSRRCSLSRRRNSTRWLYGVDDDDDEHFLSESVGDDNRGGEDRGTLVHSLECLRSVYDNICLQRIHRRVLRLLLLNKTHGRMPHYGR